MNPKYIVEITDIGKTNPKTGTPVGKQSIDVEWSYSVAWYESMISPDEALEQQVGVTRSFSLFKIKIFKYEFKYNFNTIHFNTSASRGRQRRPVRLQ